MLYLLALSFQQQQVQLSHQDLVPLQRQLVSQPVYRSELEQLMQVHVSVVFKYCFNVSMNFTIFMNDICAPSAKVTLSALLHTVACTCPQLTVTVTVLSVLLSLVLTLSLSTCTVSAVVNAVMYKRLQRCRAELTGGELCSTPQLSQSLL